MGALIIGFFAGSGSPFQTSVNATLNKRLGSPFTASFVSFIVGTSFLVLLTLLKYHTISIPFGQLAHEPIWIWFGGTCGMIYITVNILLMPRLGSVQTVVFPLSGLVMSGLIIDQFALFNSTQISISISRMIGAVLVVGGVVIIAKAKIAGSKNGQSNNKPATIYKKTSHIWLWRLLGFFGGVMSGTQFAINGYLGKCMGAPLLATLISFVVGTFSILAIVLVVRPKLNRKADLTEKFPWWIWIGGAIGAVYVLSNAYIVPILGTGMAVIITQTGQMCGSLTIDHFGIVRSPKNPINIQKIIGILLVIIGAAIIRLL